MKSIFLLFLAIAAVSCETCLLCDLFDDSAEDSEILKPRVVHVRDRFESSEQGTDENSRVIPIGNHEDEDNGGAGEMIQKVTSVSNLAQNLFGRLLGIVGDKFVRTHPSSHFESSVDIRENKKISLNDKSSKEHPDNMSQSIFGLFDSLSDIPAVFEGHIDGPHVCVRELNIHLPNSNDTYKINKKCQWFSQAQRCISRRQTPEESVETTRIQECCNGYDTEDISKGCPKKAINRSLDEISSTFNISNFEFDAKTAMKTFIINPNLQALVIDGIKPDYEMEPEQDLVTENGQLLLVSQPSRGSITETYINCVKLNKANVMFHSNLLHIANDDIKPASKNLLNLLETDGRFTHFFKLLSNTSKTLLSSEEAELTVLAFTDDIFGKLSERLQQQIIAKKACVEDIDRSHILRSSRCVHQLEDAVLIALTGQMYHLEKINGLHRIGNARIIESNLVARNGIVHVVDNLLMKEELIPWEENLKRYNRDLSEKLQTLLTDMDEPTTIFVPPQKNDSQNIYDNALSHVVTGKLISLTNNSPLLIKTASNSTIFAGRFPSTSALSIRLSVGHHSSATAPFQIGCSKISRTSVFSCNSVIHFIDKEIDSPTQTIDEFLKSHDILKLFNDLYANSEEKNYDHSKHIRTVFAPTNDAFSKNGYRRLQQSSSSVESFIRRHTIERPLCDHDMRHGKKEIRVEIISNRNGEGLRVQERSGDLYVEEAKIEEYHVLSDGIVYVVDSSISKSEQRYQPDSSMRSATDLLNIFH